MRNILAAIVAFLVSSQLWAATSEQNVAGSYKAVSESEWSLELQLNPNHSFSLVHSMWSAGEYANRTTKRYSGKWSVDGSWVILSYEGITERLKYQENLSLEELGLSGGIPGLKADVVTDNRAVIGTNSLWKSSAIKQRIKN